MAPAPETVTEAVAFLTAEGYTDELHLEANGLGCDTADHAHSGGVHPASTAIVDYTFRFEGPSDPGDEAIVLGIRCPEWGTKGVLVSAFGPYTDPVHAEILAALVPQ